MQAKISRLHLFLLHLLAKSILRLRGEEQLHFPTKIFLHRT